MHVCVHVWQRVWLPATGLELQAHHCKHTHITVSKLAAKKKSMAERQRLGRAWDSAVCDLGSTHIHPFPAIRLEHLTQLSQAEEAAGRWLGRPPCMRLSRSQVTRSTFLAHTSLVLPRQEKEEESEAEVAAQGQPWHGRHTQMPKRFAIVHTT